MTTTTIVLRDEIYYSLFEEIDERARRRGISEGNMICDGQNAWEYTPSPNIWFARCVVKHDGRFYVLPCIYSVEGTFDRTTAEQELTVLLLSARKSVFFRKSGKIVIRKGFRISGFPDFTEAALLQRFAA